MPSMMQIFLLLLIFLIFILPMILPLHSKRVQGNEKFMWFLSSALLSWVGYLVYYYVVVRHKPSVSV